MKIDDASFRGIPVQRILDHCTAVYLTSAGDPLVSFRRTSPAERQENEVRLDQKLTELEEAITLRVDWQKIPDGDLPELADAQRSLLKTLLTEFLMDLDGSRLLLDQPFLAFFIQAGYLEAAEGFIARARQEETALTQEEVFQALRNVWIMNSLQISWSLPLGVTPPVYAYSMLYPYTDNFLDDPLVGIQAKQNFNGFLTDALLGHPVAPRNFHERKTASLLAQIEGYYPRVSNPLVWQSLLLIQKGQVESLRQSSGLAEPEDLLSLSFLKGGASVLADGFLVNGTLEEEQQTFAFSYGAFLQLLDDLQDIEEDLACRHMTLFSRKDPEDRLDAEILKLIAFIVNCNRPKAGDPENMSFMKEVIVSCTLMMILAAAAGMPDRLSPDLLARLEGVSKIPLSGYLHLEKRLQRMIRGLKNRFPAESPL